MAAKSPSISTRLSKWFPLLLIIGIVIFLYQQTIFFIAPGFSGIRIQGHQVKNVILKEGFHMKWPFWERIEFIDLHLLTYEIEVKGFSKDMIPLTGKVLVQFSLKPETIVQLFQKVGSQYRFTQSVLIPHAKEIFQSLSTQWTAEEWIKNRESVVNSFKERFIQNMNQSLSLGSLPNVVNWGKISLIELKFPDSVVKLWQNKLRSDVNAQLMLHEANILKSNEALLQLRAIEKWNGRLPYDPSNSASKISTNSFSVKNSKNKAIGKWNDRLPSNSSNKTFTNSVILKSNKPLYHLKTIERRNDSLPSITNSLNKTSTNSLPVTNAQKTLEDSRRE
jgi:regulator of protease activity HflC (stomatin/prohibitin superfamily)